MRPGRALALILLLVMAALGVHAYAVQIQLGDGVTGLRSVGAGGAVWGLYVVMDGFFLGIGVALMGAACVARFSRDRAMEAVARIAMPSAIACFLGAGLSVMADQGRPLAALANLSLYARPQSPMFVTFTAVGAVCLFASLLHCVLARRPDLAEYAKRPSAWQGLQRLFAAGYRGTPGQRYRRRKAGFWMSLLMLPALFAPATAVAILFVVRPSRSLDAVLLEAAAFLLTSLSAGIGLLVLTAALVEKVVGRDAGVGPRGYLRLARWLLLAVAVSALATVAAEVQSVTSRDPAVALYGQALLHTYGRMFWTGIGCLLLAASVLWQTLRRWRGRIGALWGASLMALVAAFLHHYWLLVGWQTHGLALPYAVGTYSPTWIEYAVALGIVAVCVLLLLPAVHLIPFAPVAVDRRGARPVRDVRRTVVVATWFLLGLLVTGVGFVGAARVGTEPAMDPVLTGSPIIFIVGLMMLATTAAIYELLPERE